MDRMQFQNVFPVKSSYTKNVLTTFSNGIKLCENGVDVLGTYYELFTNVRMILNGNG